MKTEGIPKWIAVGLAVLGALSGAGFTIFQVMTHEDRLVVVEDKVAKAELEHASDDKEFEHYNYRLDKLDHSMEKVDGKLDRLLERTP
jgi:hypothetical protein